MTLFRVSNPISGVELGDFTANNEAMALDMCAQDAGYEDLADCVAQTGLENELIARRVDRFNLGFKEVDAQDLSGQRFYVAEGDSFDSDDYARAFNLNASDLDEQDVKAACDAASGLAPGHWLEVTHEAAPTP